MGEQARMSELEYGIALEEFVEEMLDRWEALMARRPEQVRSRLMLLREAYTGAWRVNCSVALGDTL